MVLGRVGRDVGIPAHDSDGSELETASVVSSFTTATADLEDETRYLYKYARPVVGTVLMFAVFCPFFAIIFHLLEGWGAWESYVFVTIVISTIGYGDITPQTDKGKITVIVCGMLGIPMALYCLSNFGHLSNRLLTMGLTRCFPNFNSMTSRHQRSMKLVAATCAMILHQVQAVVMYRYMEGWSWTTSVYYVFTCFATIGLGDYVPAMHEPYRDIPPLSWYHVWHLATVGIGLAFIAMFFEIEQESVEDVIHKVASFINIAYEVDPIEETRRKMLASAFIMEGTNFEGLFYAIDRSKDGHITYLELLAFCRDRLRLPSDIVLDEQIQRVFEAIDADDSGLIEHDELVKFLLVNT